MKELNKALCYRLAEDICNYLEYLRRYHGYSITLHDIDYLVNDCWPILLGYNYHECAVCREIKCSQAAWDHCIERQDKVLAKAKSGPFCGACCAGVGEYVFPLWDMEDNVSGFLCVSGYTLDREQSRERAISTAQKYGLSIPRMQKAVAFLKEDLPDPDILAAQIRPVQSMLATLIHFNNSLLPSYNSEQEKTYHQLLDYIHRNYRTVSVSLRSACAALGCGYSYGSHLFAEYCGMTFSQYVKAMRISTAKRYLENTRLSIAFIASECGFSDSNYFSLVFREETGVAPRTYRKQWRIEHEPANPHSYY